MDDDSGPQLREDAREQLLEFLRSGGTKRLVHYAASKLRRRRWYGRHGGLAPGGTEAEDLADEAITDLVAGLKGGAGKGSRAWNPTEQELGAHLRKIVDSKVSHLVRRAENWRVTPEFAAPVRDEDAELPYLDSFEAATGNPAKALEREEQKRLAKEFFGAFFDSVEDDPELQRALAIMQEGALKPREIAERMRMSPGEVYKIQKRLRRRLVAFEKQWNESGRETPETVKGK